eukprot:jgi/Bigna1/78118/fgenesh1_pg.52_\
MLLLLQFSAALLLSVRAVARTTARTHIWSSHKALSIHSPGHQYLPHRAFRHHTRAPLSLHQRWGGDKTALTHRKSFGVRAADDERENLIVPLKREKRGRYDKFVSSIESASLRSLLDSTAREVDSANPIQSRWTRSYVSNPKRFLVQESDHRTFDHVNSSLFLEDRTDESKYFSVGYQAVLILGMYFTFPLFQRIIAPSLLGINIDDITASVTGAFSPAMDVLYALLASTTVGLLQSRQDKIQDAANAELNELRVLTWLIMQLAQEYNGKSQLKCEELLVLVWKYTDLLIFSSRSQEIVGIASDDILKKLHHGLYALQVGESATTTATTNTAPVPFKETNLDEVIASRVRTTSMQARMHVEAMMGHRTLRLDKEGQGVVPAILAIVDLLALYIVISFTLLSSALELEPISMLGPMQSVAGMLLTLAHYVESSKVSSSGIGGGGGIGINAEAALFATLTSALLTIRSLFYDLESPFTGHSRVRRTVSSSTIFAIRNDIEMLFAEGGGTNHLLKEVKRSSSEAFLDYERHKGIKEKS